MKKRNKAENGKKCLHVVLFFPWKRRKKEPPEPAGTAPVRKSVAGKIKGKMGIRSYLFLSMLLTFFLALLTSNVVTMVLRIVIGDTFDHTVLTAFLFSLVAGAAALTVLSRSISAPILRLGDAMRQVAEGDFTVKMKTESTVAELREAYLDFNTMTGELKSNEMLQSDFVSNVSHEFKTPLNAIEGYATLLTDDSTLSPEQRVVASKIVENTSRMTDLVTSILLLSKLEHQVIVPPGKMFSMDESVRHALVAAERKWTEKNLELDVELEEINFFGNESLIYHVFSNLIDNAIKFNRVGGQLILRLTMTRDDILFRIRDTGIGMSEEQQKHIFDRFFQADHTHSSEGNGLGLSLVKRIMDVQGGSIRIDSKPGEGTEFTVVFPKL